MPATSSETVFITGHAGLLGSHLANAFVWAGHRVIGLDDLSGGLLENINPLVVSYTGNCADSDLVRQIIEMQQPELVYHFAAWPYEGGSHAAPARVSRETGQASLVVFQEACRSPHVRRICFASSMARYGHAQPPPFVEDGPVGPVDVYGHAKLFAERCLMTLADLTGKEWVILVPHNVFGPGINLADPYRNVLTIWMNTLLQGGDPIIFGDGQQRRAPSWMNDLVGPLVASGTMDDAAGHVINLGASTPYTLNTLYEMVNQAMANLGVRPRSARYEPARPNDVALAWCDVSKGLHLFASQETPVTTWLPWLADWVVAVGPTAFDYDRLTLDLPDLAPAAWRSRAMAHA